MSLEGLWLRAWIDGLQRQGQPIDPCCPICAKIGGPHGVPAQPPERPVQRPAPIPAPRTPRA